MTWHVRSSHVISCACCACDLHHMACFHARMSHLHAILDTYIGVMTQRFPHQRQAVTDEKQAADTSATSSESGDATESKQAAADTVNTASDSTPSVTSSDATSTSDTLTTPSTTWSPAALSFARTWWYARDPTHVVFYQLSTMRWMATWLEWELVHEEKAVYIFRRKARNRSEAKAVTS